MQINEDHTNKNENEIKKRGSKKKSEGFWENIWKNYRAELFLEIALVLFLLVLSWLGVYHFDVSINSDGAFTVGLLALPVPLFTYLRSKKEKEHTRHQELYSTILNEMMKLPSESGEILSDPELKLKVIKLSELYRAGNKSLFDSELESFGEAAKDLYYDLIVQGFVLESDNEGNAIETSLEEIEKRLNQNQGTKGVSGENLENINWGNDHEKLGQRFKNLYWKNSNAASDKNSAFDQLMDNRYQVFYKTTFTLDDNVQKTDVQNLQKPALVISPIFSFENIKDAGQRERIREMVAKEIKESDGSISAPKELDNNGKVGDFKVKKKLNESANIEATITYDDRKEIISSRAQMKAEYSANKQAIVKFSTTYPSDDDYKWHTWFTFTNRMIGKIRDSKADEIKEIKFVADGAPKKRGGVDKPANTNRIITFTRDAFLALVDLKVEIPEYTGPDYKKFFYFNFTSDNNNERAKLIDTRDIEGQDFAKIEVTDGKVKPISKV